MLSRRPGLSTSPAAKNAEPLEVRRAGVREDQIP
jgi:hypothetical protein